MRIERAIGWNRKQRKCEHCECDILKDEPIILLFAEVILMPTVYRGIAFHEECAREEFEDIMGKIT